MKCHICTSTSNLFSKYQILGKYDIAYYQCTECGFVQTESPYWLDEAYSEAIADSDIGLVYRNLNLSVLTDRMISNHFDSDASFLDYGGGYGLFVRLMRDNGFDFHWEDKFCKNIFAKNFVLNPSIKYELVTAFEVFEHLSDPLMEIEAMLQFSDNILFSTELLPASNPRPGEWWYYAPQTGQHISFYSEQSLQKIAEQLRLNCYSDGSSNHILSRKKLPNNLFSLLPQTSRRQSLLPQDAAQLLAVDLIEVKQEILLPLQEHNLLMFPDWSVDEELLCEELSIVIRQIIQTSDIDSTALLLDVSSAGSLEQVELILAGISMNLLMEQDLDISEHLAISPVGMLSIEQWQQLLPSINNLVAFSHQTSIIKAQLVTAGLNLPEELCFLFKEISTENEQ